MGSKAQNTEVEAKAASLLAFQPVFARNLDLKAFEVLLEDPGAVNESLAEIQAFSRIIVETYTTTYEQGKLRTLPCFLPVGAEVLSDPEFTKLAKSHYIFEIEPSLHTDELSQRLKALVASGYRLALSSYDGSEAAKELLSIVHILKIDVAKLSLEALNRLVDEVRPYNADLLAENIQSPEQFRHCLDAGFQYFRGDLLGKPERKTGKVLASNKLLLIQILSELDNPSTTMDSLERLILQDANLTYKFIKVVNSASYGMEREIETLAHALRVLGTNQLRSWISMFLLEGHEQRPDALVRSMLVRGRMCETIAEIVGKEHAIRYFIVGLLSKLDVLTEIAMADLMSSVSLKKEMKDALLNGSGSMGEILREVEHYEQGRFDQLTSLPDRSFYETAYRHSTAWAHQLQSAVYS